ncbi:pseudouridine synthase [Moraxella canis]|uniref:pseudouridine synthase n=1 Tax=Moraxella canis TaxID=90239 RepID=UPI00080A8534|nr:pseudouridine synthase [Moraxella canis]
MAKLILFNKPYGVHSQFKKDHDDMATLAGFIDDKTMRVAGRLDKDSEGLLLLTDHGELNHAITTPPTAHNAKYTHAKYAKTYLVQVENIPTEAQIKALEQGVMLKDGKTLPAKVRQLDENALPIHLWPRNPPIRQRANIPTAWLEITITEGKNRQVRRMVAHVGLPCLRLIRHQIGRWQLDGLAVGESRTVHLDDQMLADMGIFNHSASRSPANKAHSSAYHASKNQSKPNLKRTRPLKFGGRG